MKSPPPPILENLSDFESPEKEMVRGQKYYQRQLQLQKQLQLMEEEERKNDATREKLLKEAEAEEAAAEAPGKSSSILKKPEVVGKAEGRAVPWRATSASALASALALPHVTWVEVTVNIGLTSSALIYPQSSQKS